MRADHLANVLLDEVDYYLSQAEPFAEAVKEAGLLNDRRVCDVWYDLSSNRLIVRSASDSPPAVKLGGIPVSYLCAERSLPDPSWCALALSADSEPKGGYFSTAREHIRNRLNPSEPPVKTAWVDKPSFADRLISLTGWNDRYYPTNPIAAMLASGVLGAGVGYGGASLASLLLPNNWDKKKFKRSGLLLGAAAGAAPGALEAFKSFSVNQPLLDGSHMRLPKEPVAEPAEEPNKEAAFPGGYVPPMPYMPGPLINGDELMRMVWKQPDIRDRLSPGERSLITGAVGGAQQIAGSSEFSPGSLGRLTRSMGTGYASGLIAGKVLGTVLGMPEDVQKDFARVGLQAGAIRATLPIIFGTK